MCPTIRIYNIYIKHGSIIYLRLSSLKDKKRSNKYNGKYIGLLDVCIRNDGIFEDESA